MLLLFPATENRLDGIPGPYPILISTRTIHDHLAESVGQCGYVVLADDRSLTVVAPEAGDVKMAVRSQGLLWVGEK